MDKTGNFLIKRTKDKLEKKIELSNPTITDSVNNPKSFNIKFTNNYKYLE
jgi:hypothetical protein